VQDEEDQCVKRILAVEDEISIANLITYNLEQSGYQVITASDGTEALRLIEAYCPHLVTLDLLLPLQSGWQVLEAIRHHPRRQIATLPVIVLSALNSARLRDEMRQNGVAHCLGKPFSVTELCMLVRTMLEDDGDAAWSSPL
jgi:two-component system alkaline phosphatase synthesis response regulator PhoP